MRDNGLMDYYRKYRNESGFLMSGEAAFTFFIDRIYQEYMKTPKENYFVKRILKDEIDAEVLLSQIYQKAGFITPTYMPVVDTSGSKMVVSEDISRSWTKEAFDVLYGISKMSSAIEKPFLGCFPEKLNDRVLLKHFTPEVLKEIIQMYGFDVAVKNCDRNLSNYFLESSNSDYLFDTLKVFDFGNSGSVFTDLRYKLKLDSELDYCNIFANGDKKTRKEMLHQFKNNETVLNFSNPSDLAERIGNINVTETAKEIKQSIGYTLDPSYVDFISYSMNDFAKDLEK